jgi:hypothetical protein
LVVRVLSSGRRPEDNAAARGSALAVFGKEIVMGFFKHLFGARRPEKPASDLDDLKRMLRESSGARDFLNRSQRAGFSVEQETPLGLVMKRKDCRVMFMSQQDKISRLALKEQGEEVLHLIEDGEFKF